MTISKAKLKEEAARLAALSKRASDAVVEAEKDTEPHADKLLARIGAWPHSGLIMLTYTVAIFGAGLFIGCK